MKGQIAHLDHDNEHSDFENLAWLCLNHHDEYDGRTSVSKGLKESEVREYRDLLYKELDRDARRPSVEPPKEVAGDHGDQAPQFIGYLEGLSGDELYRLAVPVLIEKAQTINFYRGENICDTLVDKGLLTRVPTRLSLEQMHKGMATPHTIPIPVWKYLTENKEWLLNTTIEKNQDRPERLERLRTVVL